MTITAELATADSVLGQFVLGAVAPARSAPGVIPTQPALSTRALPYLGHLYANDGVTFKGSIELLDRPPLKATLNAGFHDITITLKTWDRSASGPAVGDVVKLTEPGGDGSVVFSGLVEDVVDDIEPGGKALHQLLLMPFITEFGNAYFNKQYVTLTDVAQFVRDACAATSHCWVTPESCPDSGVLGIWNFNATTALEALTIARRILGLNGYFFVDQIGHVWFGQVNLAAPAAYSVKRGVDFNARKRSAPLGQLKNKVLALGGYAPGASSPLTSKYPSAEPSASQRQYGVRMLDPLIFPTVTDQGTLDKVVATYGAAFDRLQVKGEMTLQNFGQRIDLRRQGGPTIRYWEPSVDSMQESEAGAGGGYQGNYIVLEVEVDGPKQKLIFGDVPVSGIQDVQAEVDRIIRRTSALPLGF